MIARGVFRFPAMLLLATCAALPASADWAADPDDAAQLAAENMLEQVRAMHGDDFESMLGEAYAFAVFPAVKRTGLMLGWASGRGVLVEDGKFSGYVRQRRFSLGFQFGQQTQAQVLLFRDEPTVAQFKTGDLEFTPQASLHGNKKRRATEASFRPDVAVFSISHDGTMIEAAVGATGFKFIPPD